MLSFLATHALQSAEVKQDVDQSVLIGDRLLIAESGAFNAQFFSQGIDALGGGALLVYLLVCVAVPIELVPDASADAGGYFGDAATFGPLWVIDGAILAGGLGKKQGTNIAPTLVGQKPALRDVGGLERHRQIGLTQGQALGIEGLFVTAALGKGNSSESAVQIRPAFAVKVFIGG